MGTSKNSIFHTFVIGELDPQSPENNTFNKGMLKQVQHDEVIFVRLCVI